ncbi:hypothetical protein N2W54_005845 [Lotmaria passim]
MQQRMVLEAGVRPTLVARPEEVFERNAWEIETPSSSRQDEQTAAVATTSSTRAKTTTVPAEQFRSDTGVDSTATRPWKAAEALLQLKLALNDIPQLRPVLANARFTAPAASAVSLEPTSAAEAAAATGDASDKPTPAFLPPVVRYATATPPSSSAYVQQTLRAVQEACARLTSQVGEAAKKQHGSASATDLQWAYVMHCLQEPRLVALLQRRAEAAIWEKEYCYRINGFLNAELRRRGVPPQAAQEDWKPFLDQVQQSRMMLDDYLDNQGIVVTLTPMLEAAVARAQCLKDVAAVSSASAINALASMERGVADLSAQVREGTSLLQKNVEAMQRRLDALQKKAAAPQK